MCNLVNQHRSEFTNAGASGDKQVRLREVYLHDNSLPVLSGTEAPAAAAAAATDTRPPEEGLQDRDRLEGRQCILVFSLRSLIVVPRSLQEPVKRPGFPEALRSQSQLVMASAGLTNFGSWAWMLARCRSAKHVVVV